MRTPSWENKEEAKGKEVVRKRIKRASEEGGNGKGKWSGVEYY